MSSIESDTAGDYTVKSAHFAYSGPAKQVLEIPSLPRLTEHDFESPGRTDFSG